MLFCWLPCLEQGKNWNNLLYEERRLSSWWKVTLRLSVSQKNTGTGSIRLLRRMLRLTVRIAFGEFRVVGTNSTLDSISTCGLAWPISHQSRNKRTATLLCLCQNLHSKMGRNLSRAICCFQIPFKFNTRHSTRNTLRACLLFTLAIFLRWKSLASKAS